MSFKRRTRKFGFTLVELLIAVTVLSVLAAVVIPKFVQASDRAKGSARLENLHIYNDAVGRFFSDTGLYPSRLDDLLATTAPAEGLAPNGTRETLAPERWHGPYLAELMRDPLTGDEYCYSVAPPNLGKVSLPATTSVTVD